jgi:hypothetical protein
MDRHSQHIPAEDARSGEKSGRMRVVLLVSCALAVLALGIVLANWV